MHRSLSRIFLSVSLFAGTAFAAPGYLWEIGMEMEGMPFAMPKQKICAEKDSKEPPVSQDDQECRVLEKKQTGNRYFWKAQCKDGLMVGDITSTPTSYSGKMKMTDKSGETVSMKMTGKRLGNCDYQDRSSEIAALQKQSDDAMKGFCQSALDEMQGQRLGDQCPKEKSIFCQRLATPEGYEKATRHLPDEILTDATSGAPALARICKLDNAKLLPKLCKNAVSGQNFAFVSRHCAADRPKLCAAAVSMTRLGYVNANCPAERTALIKEHCEGRKYSSDIEPRFANFCANAGAEIGNYDPSSDAAASAPETAETVEDKAVEKVQKGLKQLKGFFGF
jgi:hypothetical protein